MVFFFEKVVMNGRTVMCEVDAILQERGRGAKTSRMLPFHNDSMCIECCFSERCEETDAVLASPSGFLGRSANVLR